MDPAEAYQRLEIARNDLWQFCSRAVYTLDQADAEEPVKQFPFHLDYLRQMAFHWEHEPLFAVKKSRRMVVTWSMITFILWDAMFHIGRANFIISKKEKDADDLVRKCFFIYNHIPEEVLPKEVLPKANYKFCKLEFPELDSYIMGLPQGEDQIRQYTASRVFLDEFAFMEKARSTWAGLKPTITGGGKISIVSTPEMSFFKAIVDDEIDKWMEGRAV